MRHRGIRFFAVDINQQPNLNFGASTQTVPMILFYPGFQKTITVHRYSGDVNSISMSKFMHKKADIKFEFREKYFKPAKNPFGDDQVMMDMDASGNIKPDAGKMAELQQKQEREERQKKEYMRYLEEQMQRGGDL